MKKYIIITVFLLFLNGCSGTITPLIERALMEDNRSSSITIYYPYQEKFFLKGASVSIYIDGEPFFFLRRGEHIRFYLVPGVHKIGVTTHRSGTWFHHKETIALSTTEGQSYYLKTYPVQGWGFGFLFYPLPVPETLFKIFKVDENRALEEISGKPVNPKERIN